MTLRFDAKATGVAMFIAVMELALGAQNKPANEVSLKISRETAPPGTIAQVKVIITEPKPITTGSSSIGVRGFDRVVGIALGDPLSAGMAVVRGDRVDITVVSPAGSFGTEADYPLITIAGHVPDDAVLGTTAPITIDPGSILLVSPTGDAYPIEVKDGLLRVDAAITIHDVVPGSDELPSGAVVSIAGGSFQPDSKVKLKETLLDEVRYVDPGRIDVVLGEPTLMHGKGIRIRNRGGSEATYFAYQRTFPSAPSSDQALRDVVPLFLLAQSDTATVTVDAATIGLAIQNRASTETVTELTFSDGSGRPIAYGRLTIPAGSYLVRSLEEIFGSRGLGPGSVQIVAERPVQTLGVDVGPASAVIARLPQ